MPLVDSRNAASGPAREVNELQLHGLAGGRIVVAGESPAAPEVHEPDSDDDRQLDQGL